MIPKNSVFIATSLDGFIADSKGNIDWLSSIPNPDGDDMGYASFMEGVDALVMGRNTFETVAGFDGSWPYNKPVFVLSNSLKTIHAKYEGKVFLISGKLKTVLAQLHKQGYYKLYVDGGTTIQSFLKEDLIDEMVLTTIPVLLGSGIPLFGELPTRLFFSLEKQAVFLNEVSQRTYSRKREGFGFFQSP